MVYPGRLPGPYCTHPGTTLPYYTTLLYTCLYTCPLVSPGSRWCTRSGLSRVPFWRPYRSRA